MKAVFRHTCLILTIVAASAVMCSRAFCWQGSSTGWCTDARGRNFRCSDAPSGGGSSSGQSGGAAAGQAIGNAITNMINQWQQQRQQQAHDANETGNQFYNNGDFETALRYYEEAYRLNPNDGVIANNLRNARVERARQLYDTGGEYFDKSDYQTAIQYFAQAVNLDPQDQRYKQSLDNAQIALRDKQKWQREENDFADARNKVGNMLDDVASKLGTQSSPVNAPGSTDSLEFITEKESAVSRGDKSSAPIDLAGKTPRDLKTPQKGLQTKDVPRPGVAPEWDPLSAKTTGEIVLKALEEGKVGGKMSASDIGVSIRYLEGYLKTENPRNEKVKEAISYLEGMQARASLGEKKKNDLAASGSGDKQFLLEAITGEKPPAWPGAKNPDAGSLGRNPLDWRAQRDEAVQQALQNGKGNLEKSIQYLELKVRKDAGADGASRNALQYMEAYQSYHEFSSQVNTSQQPRK